MAFAHFTSEYHVFTAEDAEDAEATLFLIGDLVIVDLVKSTESTIEDHQIDNRVLCVLCG